MSAPDYVLETLMRPELDERLNELIGAYRAVGIGVVACIITNRPDEENPGRAIWDGGVFSTLGVPVKALDYASRHIAAVHAEYVSEGREVVGDEGVAL